MKTQRKGGRPVFSFKFFPVPSVVPPPIPCTPPVPPLQQALPWFGPHDTVRAYLDEVDKDVRDAYNVGEMSLDDVVAPDGPGTVWCQQHCEVDKVIPDGWFHPRFFAMAAWSRGGLGGIVYAAPHTIYVSASGLFSRGAAGTLPNTPPVIVRAGPPQLRREQQAGTCRRR